MRENPRPAFITAFLLALLFVIANSAKADEPGDIRGCIATYFSNSGKYAFEPFLKIQDKESPAEDGAPEIWGFRPWNLEPPDKEGKTHPVNIREDQFIELRTFKQVGPRKVKCPENLWGGGE
jgi:hypothetical protein